MWLIVICSLVILAWLAPRWRLRQVLARAFPTNYSKILRRNLPQYRHMPTDLQMQLKRLIRQFLFEKKFVGCDGLQISDEMRVTIAGKACLLLLNKPSQVYPKLSHVLVYPGAFQVTRHQQQAGIVSQEQQVLAGESWQDGRVILAWDQIVHSQRRQAHADHSRDHLHDHPAADHAEHHDVVLHEFAHQLDSETGVTNGTPILGGSSAYGNWQQVMQREYQHLQMRIEHLHGKHLPGNQTPGWHPQVPQEEVIDPYGATNPAEFFAVCTEAFFCRSAALADRHPELFGLLRDYYRVDPRNWPG